MQETNKVVRTICYFSRSPTGDLISQLNSIEDVLLRHNYFVQTKRICSPSFEKIMELDKKFKDEKLLLSLGTINQPFFNDHGDDILSANNISFNIDLTNQIISESTSEILFYLIRRYPNKTFNFAYVFNNQVSSPFFPSANFVKNGFSIGLQPTDLSQGATSIEEWLGQVKNVWIEIAGLFGSNPEFLGIDSSIAPDLTSQGSFIGFINSLGLDFSKSVTTDSYVKISKFIKEQNIKKAGLCGLMFPALEDTVLAREYEKGNFSIERNIFLSLHSGLGIDTYPIGVNEQQSRVIEILKLVKELSGKYKKPLSVRFVSDGKATIGQKTDFKNQYLKDVVVRAL